MKYRYTILLLLCLLLSHCKNDNNQKSDPELEQLESITKDSLQVEDRDFKTLDKSVAIEIKQKELIEKKDEREVLQQLIIEKSEVFKSNDFVINFKYPLLNTSLNSTYSNFNTFINTYYANVTKTIADIKENKLLCDSIAAKNFREERFIDYKIYTVNDQILSVLFYKENFYSGAMHPSYSFDCFNFDLNKGVFMNFEDFFTQGSEEELLSIINLNIKNSIRQGDLYYDCWELSSDDFFTSKNNFVINDTSLAFYFDDCVMCPSYTGTYSIELPLTELLSVLKKSNTNSKYFIN